jgi:hypothetical protein
MGPVNKRINFAFDIGERVWLLCDPVSSGIVDGFRVGLGYLPKYIVAFPNGKSVHTDYELTRDEPNPFQSDTSGDE